MSVNLLTLESMIDSFMISQILLILLENKASNIKLTDSGDKYIVNHLKEEV